MQVGIERGLKRRGGHAADVLPGRDDVALMHEERFTESAIAHFVIAVLYHNHIPAQHVRMRLFYNSVCAGVHGFAVRRGVIRARVYAVVAHRFGVYRRIGKFCHDLPRHRSGERFADRIRRLGSGLFDGRFFCRSVHFLRLRFCACGDLRHSALRVARRNGALRVIVYGDGCFRRGARCGRGGRRTALAPCGLQEPGNGIVCAPRRNADGRQTHGKRKVKPAPLRTLFALRFGFFLLFKVHSHIFLSCF